MQFTESVRSFQVPATPGTSAWPPRMPSVPTSRATRVTSSAKVCSVAVIEFSVCASSATSPRAVTVICWLRSPRATAWATDEMPRTWLVRLDAITFTESVRSFQVPGHAAYVGLAAQPSLGADLAGHARHLGREGRQLVDHPVDGVLQLRHLAGHLDGHGLGEVAVRHGRGHQRDVAHLRGQPRRHRVDGVDQVAPGAVRVADPCLAAELALGADLAGHPRDLVGDARELVDQPVHALGQLAAARRAAAGRPGRGPSAGPGRPRRRRRRRGPARPSGGPGRRPGWFAASIDFAQPPSPTPGLEALGVPALAAGDPLDAGQLAGEVLLPLGDLVVGQGQVDRRGRCRWPEVACGSCRPAWR